MVKMTDSRTWSTYGTFVTFGILGAIFGLSLLEAPNVGAQSTEATTETLAAKVRVQGHPCIEATSAERDPEASSPDHLAWILTCQNATYRVRLNLDREADIERLD